LTIKKLRCLTDNYTVEESSLMLQNVGLPADFWKHFVTVHKNANPKEGVDYSSDDVMVMG